MYSVEDRKFVASEFSREVTVTRITLRGTTGSQYSLVWS